MFLWLVSKLKLTLILLKHTNINKKNTIAGGITINAIVYPYYPLNSELLKRVFLRAFFGLFVTEKDDLNGKI